MGVQELHARLYPASNLLKHRTELQKLFWLRRCHEFGFTVSSTELQRPHVLGSKMENIMPRPYRHYSKLAEGRSKFQGPLSSFFTLSPRHITCKLAVSPPVWKLGAKYFRG